MARLLPLTGESTAGDATTTVLLSMASFIFCVLAVMACASHGRKWQRFFSTGRYHEQNPVISVNQVQPGEPCLWQRSIIMGEKCQLPEFSGVITYDPAGNIVRPDGSAAVQAWRK